MPGRVDVRRLHAHPLKRMDEDWNPPCLFEFVGGCGRPSPQKDGRGLELVRAAGVGRPGLDAHPLKRMDEDWNHELVQNVWEFLDTPIPSKG